MILSALSAATLLASACGGSGASTAAASPSQNPVSSPTQSPAPSPAATGEKIAVTNNARYGQVLVDGKGMTVYVFVKDAGTSSTCYGQCATYWPPVLTAGTPQAGAGVDATLLGTTTRTDGNVEVTYAGHPLYYFVQDKAPGDATGQGINGFGDLWWVVSPAGVAITAR